MNEGVEAVVEISSPVTIHQEQPSSTHHHHHESISSVSSTPKTSHHDITIAATSPTKSPLISTLNVMMTPIASPMKKAIESMQGHLEEFGHFTKLNPQEAWLPVTESRNGNAYYAAFHTLSSGLGAQALVLPLAFISLGWTWGILSLALAFSWQLYTIWLLIQLHESVPGMRYSRYLWLSMAAFGNKLGKLFALFPTMYLSGGTCVTLIMIGGGTMKTFFQIVSENTTSFNHLSMTEWYLVFTISAIILAQLPNLNSIAGVSLVASLTAVSYCTMIWVVTVLKDRPMDISYEPSSSKMDYKSEIGEICSILNALGIIAFAFRGHNLVLEIQGTMPSSPKNPSRLPMWKGVKVSYLIIALCLFPLAIGGYWAYGVLIPTNGGIMSALNKYHRNDTSKVILGTTSLLIVFNSLTSFQIYAMPVFDNFEFRFTSNNNRPCPRWLRVALRLLFCCLAFFIAVALPFLPSLAGLLGGISLPITFAYPCMMWNLIMKPNKYKAIWFLNWTLGFFGIVLSILLVFGAIWTIVTEGIQANFFRPR